MEEKIILECKGCKKAVDFLIQEIWLLRRSRTRIEDELKEAKKLLKELNHE